MVVDDSLEAATALAYLLQAMGCRTAVAYDGLTAVRLAFLYKPHLSLVDFEMPGLNGCDAIRHIREQEAPERHVAVCLTGHANRLDEQRYLDAGFDFLINKPMDAAALEKLMHACAVRRATGEPG